MTSLKTRRSFNNFRKIRMKVSKGQKSEFRRGLIKHAASTISKYANQTLTIEIQEANRKIAKLMAENAIKQEKIILMEQSLQEMKTEKENLAAQTQTHLSSYEIKLDRLNNLLEIKENECNDLKEQIEGLKEDIEDAEQHIQLADNINEQNISKGRKVLECYKEKCKQLECLDSLHGSLENDYDHIIYQIRAYQKNIQLYMADLQSKYEAERKINEKEFEYLKNQLARYESEKFLKLDINYSQKYGLEEDTPTKDSTDQGKGIEHLVSFDTTLLKDFQIDIGAEDSLDSSCNPESTTNRITITINDVQDLKDEEIKSLKEQFKCHNIIQKDMIEKLRKEIEDSKRIIQLAANLNKENKIKGRKLFDHYRTIKARNEDLNDQLSITKRKLKEKELLLAKLAGPNEKANDIARYQMKNKRMITQESKAGTDVCASLDLNLSQAAVSVYERQCDEKINMTIASIFN